MAIALAAAGEPGTIARLGAAMLTIQFGIGATNDLADAQRDAIAKPAKPIPAGSLGRGAARAAAILSFVAGFGLAASVGPGVLGLAVLGAGAGVVYDLRLKGTPISWLPYTLGVPLLPLFAWLGASGTLPGPILVAAGLAVPAGAGLALANELPDLERDMDAGLLSATEMLGRRSAWAVGALLQGVVAVGAATTFGALGGRPAFWPVTAASIALLGVGVGLGAGASVTRRQRAWEVQAVALGLLGAAWLAGVVPRA
jgi:4-hydroxybenzoate polyprenyltransferase